MEGGGGAAEDGRQDTTPTPPRAGLNELNARSMTSVTIDRARGSAIETAMQSFTLNSPEGIACATSKYNKPCFGIDLGGTLCKVCYFEKAPSEDDTVEEIQFREKIREILVSPITYGETGSRDVHFEFDSTMLGGHVYFMQFASRKMPRFLEMVESHNVVTKHTQVCGTGGGAKKFGKRIKEVLNITITHSDELNSLITGINFMFKQSRTEAYRVNHATYEKDGKRQHIKIGRTSFPYLLVNIGSGVSILKVYRDGKHERVGGTALGGSTFFGLCCMLTGCSTFEDALSLAERGDASTIDLLVEDIYGGDYAEFDLPGSTVASSLGKLANPEVREKAKRADLARAVLDAITNNVGSLALLHAKAHNTPEIIFAGNFLRKNWISVARLAFSVEFWSKNARHASFLTHEGYLGAFGALMTQLGPFSTPAQSPERPRRPEAAHSGSSSDSEDHKEFNAAAAAEAAAASGAAEAAGGGPQQRSPNNEE